VLDVILYRVGVWGIPLGTAICNVAGTWALLVLLRRRLQRIDGGEIAATTVKVVLASAVVGGVAWAIWTPLDSALGRSFPAQACSLGAALLAAVAAYLLCCRLLRVREMDALLSLRARFGRA
jgi:peptidoglycan biosynthesis protein MviN/MurJ (putative lipid II flippase)